MLKKHKINLDSVSYTDICQRSNNAIENPDYEEFEKELLELLAEEISEENIQS